MRILNLLKNKLPEGKVVWCIGIPYTKEMFLNCCKKTEKSDFIDSLEILYNTTNEEILWEYYKHIAIKISDTINFLHKKRVTIIDTSSVEHLKDVFSASVIIITAHRHRFSECLDFMGNNIIINDIINCIPKDFNGTMDISSCYSATFQMKCKQKAINGTYIAAETESSIELRLFIYQQTIKHLISHPNETYLKSLKIIITRIIRNNHYKENKRDYIFLGGKMPLKKHTSNASAFAPNEIRRGETMMIQIYVYKNIKHKNVICDAKKADINTTENCRIPLNFELNQGDKVNIILNIFQNPKLSQTKSFIWNEKTSKTCFFVSIPKNYKKDKISFEIFLSVNNALMGELDFYTSVVDLYSSERKLADVMSKHFQKVFISYSHLDEQYVSFIAQAYKAIGIKYFFDRHYLSAGDIFPLKIKEFIESADLFILCWSANAAKSNYVNIERRHALKRAFPNVNIEKASLSIYPISIEPRTELPNDMKDTYNFEVI